jgi:hypothetical protein
MKKVRPIKIDGDLAYVPLTQGCIAVIDAKDIPLVENWNWYALRLKNTFYAFRNDRTGSKPRLISMHRTIMLEPDGFQVDHKDGNGLNNRRENLRQATHQQNNVNRKLTNANKSGYKGIWLDERTNKWRAQICWLGKRIRLGSFLIPEAAHLAYCEASHKIHGDFGRTS